MYNTCSALTESYFYLNVTVSEINGGFLWPQYAAASCLPTAPGAL